MDFDRNKIRNIGIVAHIDAGKTTVSERILYYTGSTYKMGNVDEGTTITDFDQEEQQRGITIYAAAVSCPWKGHTVNLIDTPGHVDFTAEVERSMRVLDGAVAVFDAKEGVQAQSETVWRQARNYKVPCICLINKMDKTGADFQMSVDSLRDRLGANPLPIQYPIGEGSEFKGIVDLVEMKAVYYEVNELGASFEERDIPDDLREDAELHRHELEERVAEVCDELMEKYLETGSLTEDEIRKGLRIGVIENHFQPVLCGSALKFIGVQRLLDAVCAYLPSPTDTPPVQGVDPKHGDQEIFRKADEKEPFCGLVFKVVSDNHSDLCYVRIYSGELKAGSRIYNTTRDRKENASRLIRVQAKQKTPETVATAGDIIAIIGLKHSTTGDTVCDPKHPILLERIEFPETVISMAIETRSSQDRDRLGEALSRLRREDPSFRSHVDEESGQTIIAGMGELHLEIVTNRLMRDMNVPVRLGQPRVSYRETITQAAEGSARFIRQTGGRGQFAVVELAVEPYEPEAGEPNVVFVSAVRGGAVRKEFIPAVRQGVLGAASGGVLAGFPLINMKVTLLDGKEHEVDSSEIAFESAGSIALKDAVLKAAPQLLEPIMRIEVIAPDEFFGTLAGDLNARRGSISHSELMGTDRIIHAEAPLAEMFGYATRLRSLSQGRASFSMEPKRYGPVPASVGEVLLAEV
jgi:elongation factor G